MSTFAILLLCVQACLIQSVYGQCGSGLTSAPMADGAKGLGAAGLGAAEAYGGVGTENVPVASEPGEAGNTQVAGQLPVLSAGAFDGNAPAAGADTISGNCGYY